MEHDAFVPKHKELINKVEDEYFINLAPLFDRVRMSGPALWLEKSVISDA